MKNSADSQQWGSYGNQYQKLMGKIPYVFNNFALSLLFPNSISLSESPVIIADIAAGPGVFFNVLFNHMREIEGKFACGSQFLVTDFAQGMIDTGKQQLLSLDLNSICAQNIEFKVVDACNPVDIEDNSLTHMVCIFGIMFFAHRAEALQRLRSKMRQGKGRACIATWNKVAIMKLCDEFGVFIDPDAVMKRPSPDKSPLSVCAQPDVLQQELMEAGFVNISVVEKTHVFNLFNDDDLFDSLFSNPAVVAMYPEFSNTNISMADLRVRWNDYLHSEVGKSKWLTIDENGNEILSLSYCANFALASV